MQLYKAETPGPVKNEKLTPRITETAKALWFIYLLITLACIGSLRLAGMNWFDAVFHAFSTLALGGFSNYDASISHYDSLAIELVLILFMLISAMNFSRHLIAWQRKSLDTYRTTARRSRCCGWSASAPWSSPSTCGSAASTRIPGVVEARGLQPRGHGDHLWLHDSGLRRLADLRAAGDADALLLRLQHGLDGGGIKMFRTLVLFARPVGS